MTVSRVVRGWFGWLVVLALVSASAAAFAQEDRRGQLVGVYPEAAGEDCLGIYWQFMVYPPDRDQIYTSASKNLFVAESVLYVDGDTQVARGSGSFQRSRVPLANVESYR
ncbi:MAG: hypothetical protein QGH45_25615 [Myxococcota bacterium]|jgi:hypothetical protein|nr:hypothetical protein [Myxococcota bacterium]